MREPGPVICRRTSSYHTTQAADRIATVDRRKVARRLELLGDHLRAVIQRHRAVVEPPRPAAIRYDKLLELLERIGHPPAVFFGEMCQVWMTADHHEARRDPRQQVAALRDHLAAVIRRQGADIELPKDPELGEVLELLDRIGVEPDAFFAELWPRTAVATESEGSETPRDPGEMER